MSSRLKILRCKLVNFIGIHMGTGKKELELFFDNDEIKVLLLGKNGSAKSVIMSCLTPFLETFDEYRDSGSLILEGEQGLKEIDYLKDDFIFKITHHYGKRNKSYIKKYDLNDNLLEDLNPIGNISLFPALVKEHLGVTKDFFAICKLGSKAESFIDFKTTKRKEYLGNFTPNIDEFLVSYKTVNAKLNVISKEAKFISDEFDKLGKLEDLEVNAKSFSKIIRANYSTVSRLESEIQKLNETITSSNERTAMVVELQDQIKSYEKIIDKLEKNCHEIDEAMNHGFSKRDFDLEKIEALLEKITSAGQEVSEMILKSETSMRVYNEQLASLETDLQNAQQSRKRLLSTVGDNVDTSEIESLQTYLEETLAPKLEQIYTIIDNQEVFDIGREDVSITNDGSEEVIEDLLNYGDILNNKINLLGSIESFIHLHRPDSLDAAEATKLYRSNIPSPEDIESLEKELAAAEKEYRNYQTLSGAFATVHKVSHLCACQNNCALNDKIKLAAKKDTGELNEIKERIDECKKRLEVARVTRSEYKTLYQALKAFSDYYHNPLFAELFISEEFNKTEIDALFNITAATIKHVRSTIIEPESKFINAIKNLSKLKVSYLQTKFKLSQFDNIGEEIKVLDETIKRLQKDIATIKSKNESSENELDALYKRRSVNESSFNATKKILELLTEIISYTTKIEEIEKELVTHRSFINQIESVKETIEGHKHTIRQAEETISTTEKRLDESRLAIARIKEYSERLEALQNDKTRLQVIKDSLDIKTGIPLILVGDYLTDIKRLSNQLLNIAFKGRFIIDFQTSDKEFRIPVYENGKQPRNDVKECSQGEQALIKTVISLAIVLQAFKLSGYDYNILYLDEVDSELDDDNRQFFLDMVDSLISKLGCQQCFIITHNHCFHSAKTGIIAMKGSKLDKDDEAFWQNKTLIHSEEF